MTKMPAYAEDFTVDWLNSALSPRLGSQRVIQCDAKDSDIPGQTAEIILLNVTYDSNEKNLPTKMVAKVTSRNSVVLEQVIANYDQYRRETSFYREFPDCGISVPDCLYAEHDADKQEMVLLLGDLAPALSPSWAASPEQVEMALSHLPGIHGKWWNDPLLRSKDWMVQYDNQAFFGAAFHAADAAQTALRELYDSPDLTIEAMVFLNSNLDKILSFFASRSFTFVHGDYHAKQMFFPTDLGGDFAVIDWQFPFVAPGPWDFARMLSMCMSTEERRSKEEKLIDNYLSGLRQKGVESYDKESFMLDYKMGLLVSQMIMCIAAADTDPQILEKECVDLGLDWRDVMFDRTQRAMEEHDVMALLHSI